MRVFLWDFSLPDQFSIDICELLTKKDLQNRKECCWFGYFNREFPSYSSFILFALHFYLYLYSFLHLLWPVPILFSFTRQNNVVVLVHYAIIHSSKTIDFFFFLRLLLVVFHYKFSFDSLSNGNFDCSVDQIESFKNRSLFIYCMLSILWRFFYFYCFAIFDPIPVISFLCRFILVETIESSMQNRPTRSCSYWNCVSFS